jgi:hypothetical protein
MEKQPSQGKSKLTIKRELRDLKDKCTRDFINELSQLAGAAISKNKNDADFRKRFDEFNLAKQEAPDEVLKIAGPPIWDYREDIAKGNVNKFLKADYYEDIKRYADKVPDADYIEDERVLIEKVKRTWHLFTKPEQEVMTKRVQSLISLYAQYIKLSRELESLE